MLEFNKVRQKDGSYKVSDGLVKRRKEEHDIFLYGAYQKK